MIDPRVVVDQAANLFPDIFACPVCEGELIDKTTAYGCVQCGSNYEKLDGIPDFLVLSSPLLEAEVKIQDRVAQSYDNTRYRKWYSKNYHELWNKWMLQDLPACDDLLDLGCGTGWISRYAHANRRIGIDVSLGMLRKAQKTGCSVARADSARLPLHSGCMDAVICRSLLHHLEKPELTVKEIARVLKVGGRAVFLDTNRTVLSTIPRWLAYQGNKFSETHRNLAFGQLRRIVASSLRIENVRFFGYFAYPVLGFPDILDIFRFLPFKRTAFFTLVQIDEIIAKIPIVNRQGWGVIIKCRRD